MKRMLFIVLFVSTLVPAFGQRIRFSDSTNSWQMCLLMCCDPPDFVPHAHNYALRYYWRDTTIGGYVYKSLGTATSNFIREDTVLQVVYIRIGGTTEYILYDYNWHIGDTVRQPTYGGYSPVCWVVGIDSTMINSMWYKVWHFQGTYFGSGVDLDYHVIEGVGCTNKFDYAILPYPYFEHSEQLYCFANHGVSYPLSNPVPSWGLLGDLYFDNVSSCFLPLKISKAVAINAINILPNPVETSLTISSQQSIDRITISNILGQIVYDHPYNSPQVQVDVSDISTGVYYIKINGTEVRRFVKQ